MSRTISRGLHSIGRWDAPALEVLEYLNSGRKPFAGSLDAIERFLTWAIAGIDEDEGRRDTKVPTMAGVCALADATSILRALGQDLDLPVVRGRLEGFRVLMRRFEHESLGVVQSDPRFDELRSFIVELSRRAELDQDRASFARSIEDDDD